MEYHICETFIYLKIYFVRGPFLLDTLYIPPEQTINKRNNKKDKSIIGQQPGLVADADASL